MKAFGELFIDETKKGIKLQTSEYKKQGNHIIVDQGKNPIAGYTDREKGLFEDVPVIIFGDHTRVIKYVDQPFFLGADGVKILRSKDKNSNYKYLYYALRNANIPDTGYNRHFKWLKETKINYPSVAMQDEIVKILDKLSDIIDRRKTQLQGLDNLIKARFVEMFENEIEYNKVKLEEIADIVSGITKGRKTKCGELREVPYMAVSNVKDGYIDWTTVKTILATEDEIIQYKLLPDDVLMTEGGDPDKLGRGAIISLPPKDCIHQNHIFRVRLDETQILPRYFAAYLQSSQAKTYFLRAAKQTTGIASINMSQLRGLPTIVPPIELQLKYSLFSEQVDKSKLLSLIKLLEQLITYLYNVFIIYRQDKGEEVERHE